MLSVRLHCFGTLPPEADAALKREVARRQGLQLFEESPGERGGGEAIDLVVWSVDHPDRYQDRELERLINGFPGAPILILGGAWCRSVLRNRHLPVVAVWTTPAEFPTRLAAELDSLLQGAAPLPLTADRAEAFAFLCRPEPPETGPPLRAGVVGFDAPLTDLCIDVLRSCGVEARRARSTQESAGADVMVVCADPLPASGVLVVAPPQDLPVLYLSHTPWAVRIPAGFPQVRLLAVEAPISEWASELRRLHGTFRATTAATGLSEEGQFHSAATDLTARPGPSVPR